MRFLLILSFIATSLPLIGETCSNASIEADTIITTLDITICAGESYEGYAQSGNYADTFHLDNGDDSIRILNLIVMPPLDTLVERWLCPGGSIEGYMIPPFQLNAIYRDTFITHLGCDSIRTYYFSLIPDCVPIVSFDLNACEAYMINGTNMDYSEFTPTYPVILEKGGFPCIELNANLFRHPPQENKHSCTPGINQSNAMCVSSYDSCEYAPGHPASVVIELDVSNVLSLMYLSGIEFYSKAPTTYEWIDGPSGLNNYPQRYGIRILENDIEIYRREDIPTTQVWTLQTFDITQTDPIPLYTSHIYRIELLPYCLVGNGAEVSAWDIDEFRIFAGCIPLESPKPLVFGSIYTPDNKPLADVQISISIDSLFSNTSSTTTDQEGYYTAKQFDEARTYYVKAEKNEDITEGVNVLDLLLIQKHLLGIQPFTSVYQYIAADIDRNGVINVLDLLDLKKILLGIPTPRNTGWRIGTIPPDYSGTDISKWQENAIIQFNGIDPVKLDWTAVKIGDVN